jgi:hypothetical protein
VSSSETLSLRVDVLPGSEPISGRLVDGGGEATQFRGWIELVAALQEASSTDRLPNEEEQSP